jgi:glycerol-3-phosphate acyltransferase PlsY
LNFELSEAPSYIHLVDALSYVLTAVLAYLLGSIPTGFLVARAKGVDIRAVGSGNIGATNVFRILGKPAGVFVLAADALKGWMAVVAGVRMVLVLFALPLEGQTHEYHALVAAPCAVMGHNYTCWLHFKGGKGIATSAGVLLALVPLALAIILTVWVIIVALTRYVSLASISASVTLPFATWLTGKSVTLVAVTGALGALAVYKHRTNIQRLLSGTETRFGSRHKEAK